MISSSCGEILWLEIELAILISHYISDSEEYPVRRVANGDPSE